MKKNTAKDSQARALKKQGASGKSSDKRATENFKLLKVLLGEAIEVKNRKFLIASVAVHILVIAAFFFNWQLHSGGS